MLLFLLQCLSDNWSTRPKSQSQTKLNTGAWAATESGDADAGNGATDAAGEITPATGDNIDTENTNNIDVGPGSGTKI